MNDSENTKTVGIHPVNDKVNTSITIFICIIFIGYILKNIYEYSNYFNIKEYILSESKRDTEKIDKFSNKCIMVSTIAFFLLVTLTILLFLYIIKDSYNLNNLNKILVKVGFPIILGIYFLNTILFTINKNITKEKRLNLQQYYFKNHTGYLTKNIFEKKDGKKLFNPKPNPLYILNPFNLTLLISIIYMIYWDNWNSPSWEKWSIYISSVILFNLLLGLIYFFQTRRKNDKIFTRKIETVNNGTRQSIYPQNSLNNDFGVPNNQYGNTNRKSFNIQRKN